MRFAMYSDLAGLRVAELCTLLICHIRTLLERHQYWCAGGSYEPYSTVGTAERDAILKAAYAVAGNLTAVQEALASEAGITCDEPEEEEEESCTKQEPRNAAQAVCFFSIYMLETPWCWFAGMPNTPYCMFASCPCSLCVSKTRALQSRDDSVIAKPDVSQRTSS